MDGLAYPDELEDLLDRTFGDGAQVDDSYGLDVGTEGWRARREIAVVVIDGAIIPGESTGPGFFGGGFATGSDTVVAQLDEARDRMARGDFTAEEEVVLTDITTECLLGGE